MGRELINEDRFGEGFAIGAFFGGVVIFMILVLSTNYTWVSGYKAGQTNKIDNSSILNATYWYGMYKAQLLNASIWHSAYLNASGNSTYWENRAWNFQVKYLATEGCNIKPLQGVPGLERSNITCIRTSSSPLIDFNITIINQPQQRIGRPMIPFNCAPSRVQDNSSLVLNETCEMNQSQM